MSNTTCLSYEVYLFAIERTVPTDFVYPLKKNLISILLDKK